MSFLLLSFVKNSFIEFCFKFFVKFCVVIHQNYPKENNFLNKILVPSSIDGTLCQLQTKQAVGCSRSRHIRVLWPLLICTRPASFRQISNMIRFVEFLDDKRDFQEPGLFGQLNTLGGNQPILGSVVIFILDHQTYES